MKKTSIFLFAFCVIISSYSISGNTTDVATNKSVALISVFNSAAASIDPPVATSGSGATTTQITANWVASSGATTYNLDVSTSIGFGSFVTGFNNYNAGNVTTCNVTGLTSGTVYYYRVRAENTCNTSSNSITITCSTTLLVIGDNYQGGKVAYILQPGESNGVYNYDANLQHGLIAALSDQSTGIPWGCGGTEITGADGTAIGTGNQNTIDIIAGCTTEGIAARICSDLVVGAYSDWYLPSKDELNKLYINRDAIGGFDTNFYWSSSEWIYNTGWLQSFGNGNQWNNPKGQLHLVRAVRDF